MTENIMQDLNINLPRRGRGLVQPNHEPDANGPVLLSRSLMLWTKTALYKMLYRADADASVRLGWLFFMDGDVCWHRL